MNILNLALPIPHIPARKLSTILDNTQKDTKALDTSAEPNTQVGSLAEQSTDLGLDWNRPSRARVGSPSGLFFPHPLPLRVLCMGSLLAARFDAAVAWFKLMM
jgi:hypothetical protein